MGIRDTCVQDCLIGFYRDTAAPDSGRGDVLRFNGDIVSVRYNYRAQ
ncbi:MAG: hypothetical protein MO846_02915 [Candidatus Devosia symbiotica]|nr:hypothetical protein [Candidatus Devosia symbiotica]